MSGIIAVVVSGLAFFGGLCVVMYAVMREASRS